MEWRTSERNCLEGSCCVSTCLLVDQRHLFYPFFHILSENRCFPGCSGEAGGWLPNAAGQLLLPSALYDPRNPDLAVLLDASEAFPAPTISDDDLALSVLAGQLGLRTVATRDTLLQVPARQRLQALYILPMEIHVLLYRLKMAIQRSNFGHRWVYFKLQGEESL